MVSSRKQLRDGEDTQQTKTFIQQAKIYRKSEEFIKESDDYKSPLNYYPKDAKGPQASPCQNCPQEERQGGCQESLAREILAFPGLM
jgi:hypothetical protein